MVMLTQTPTVYQTRATQSRKRNARIDARLTAEFAARAVALQAKLDAIVAANTSASLSASEAKRNEAWKADIEEAMDAIPENPAEIFTPEEIGRMDFDEGLDPDASRHYASLDDMAAYELGYKQGYREAEDTAEYAEDILDREYHASGAW